jgi:hypothetical protein
VHVCVVRQLVCRACKEECASCVSCVKGGGSIARFKVRECGSGGGGYGGWSWRLVVEAGHGGCAGISCAGIVRSHGGSAVCVSESEWDRYPDRYPLPGPRPVSRYPHRSNYRTGQTTAPAKLPHRSRLGQGPLARPVPSPSMGDCTCPARGHCTIMGDTASISIAQPGDTARACTRPAPCLQRTPSPRVATAADSAGRPACSTGWGPDRPARNQPCARAPCP